MRLPDNGIEPFLESSLKIRHEKAMKVISVEMRGEVKWKSESCSVMSLCDLTDCTVHGILQARILEWVAVPFSRGSSQSRDWTQVSHTAGEFFTSWMTREAQEYWSGYPFSRGPSWARNWTGVSCTAGPFFTAELCWWNYLIMGLSHSLNPHWK